MDEYLRELEGVAKDPDERRRRRRLIAAIAVAGLSLVTLGTLTTGALFTDSQDLGANSFTTGTLVLGLTPTTALFSVANMAPGDTVSKPLTVTDAGTLGLRYAVTGSATNPDGKALNAQLQFTVYSAVSAANCTAGAFGGGTVLYGPAALGASSPVFGNPAQGNQPGDRTLAAAASEPLCFVATLPLSTDNTFQAATTTVSFTFDAEQTKNNP
jgi:spore coat-associated protein N